MIEKADNGDVIEVNIRLTSTLLAFTLVLLIILPLLGILGVGYRKASAVGDATANRASAGLVSARKFYLTEDGYKASQAVLACGIGYHFASVWELLDTSNLAYANDTGAVWQGGDQGSGPPSEMPGWIRTGYESESNTGVPGRDNCSNWTSEKNTFDGTTVQLRSDWTAVGGNFLHGWEVTAIDCGQERGVWCIED